MVLICDAWSKGPKTDGNLLSLQALEAVIIIYFGLKAMLLLHSRSFNNYSVSV